MQESEKHCRCECIVRSITTQIAIEYRAMKNTAWVTHAHACVTDVRACACVTDASGCVTDASAYLDGRGEPDSLGFCMVMIQPS